MAGTNDFLTFADADGANVESQADYAADANRATGFEAGKASSARANKIWRQATAIVSAVAQLIPDLLGVNAADDGDSATLLANLKSALKANNGSSRTIIAASPQAITATDSAVFVNQTIAAAIQLNLPGAPAVNQEVTFYDDKGDADVNFITISGNGNPIANLPANKIQINSAYGAVTLRWNNAATAWRVKP